jgi:hypothetical protein
MEIVRGGNEGFSKTHYSIHMNGQENGQESRVLWSPPNLMVPLPLHEHYR